jgi:hypothetical protein
LETWYGEIKREMLPALNLKLSDIGRDHGHYFSLDKDRKKKIKIKMKKNTYMEHFIFIPYKTLVGLFTTTKSNKDEL